MPVKTLLKTVRRSVALPRQSFTPMDLPDSPGCPNSGHLPDRWLDSGPEIPSKSFTYRMSDHTTSDDATRYRTEKELKYWLERDPISRFRTYLVGKGLWDDAREKTLQAELAQFVEDEVKKAESYPPPSLDEVYSYTYASISDNLRSQLERHRRDLAGKEG